MGELYYHGKIYWPNAVFEIPAISQGQQRAIIALGYFKMPSLERIIDLSKRSAQFAVYGSSEESLLEQSYRELHQDRGILYDVIKEFALTFERSEMVTASFAKLSGQALEDLAKASRDYFSFTKAIEKKLGGYEFALSLLVQQGQLPSKSMINSHLGDGVTLAHSLQIEPLGLDYRNEPTMMETVNAIYQILHAPFAYKLLPDTSEMAIKTAIESKIIPHAIGAALEQLGDQEDFIDRKTPNPRQKH